MMIFIALVPISSNIILWIWKSFLVFHTYSIKFITNFIEDISRFIKTVILLKNRHVAIALFLI